MSEIKIQHKKMSTSTKIFIVVMLLLPISNFLIFWLGVNASSLLLAFRTDYADGTIEWGFQQFILFFEEITTGADWPLAIKNTMIFFCTSLFIILPASVVLCYFIFKKIAGYKFFRFVFYLPCILSPMVLAYLFRYIVEPTGPIDLLLNSLGLQTINFLGDERYAIWTTVFYNVFFSLGGNMILLSGAMTHVNESVIEAGQLDGVGMVREIVQLVVPLIWPTLTSLIIFTFVGMFSASGPILILKGEGTQTIAYKIYMQVLNGGGNYNFVSAVGWVCTVIATPLVLVIRYFLNKTMEAVES